MNDECAVMYIGYPERCKTHGRPLIECVRQQLSEVTQQLVERGTQLFDASQKLADSQKRANFLAEQLQADAHADREALIGQGEQFTALERRLAEMELCIRNAKEILEGYGHAKDDGTLYHAAWGWLSKVKA